MLDVQSRIDERGVAIQKVGIKEAQLPFQIKTKAGGFQQVLANICFTVELPSEYKGTHMSRFLEILMPWSQKPLAESEMEAILAEALDKLNANQAEIKLSFKYFITKAAPVTKKQSILDLDCFFLGRKKRGEKMQFFLGVAVPFTSLCPCSKEISSFGAHNQRSVASVKVQFKDGCDCILIEDLAELIEREGSAAIYPLLKREDEKFVTEAAYNNPKFVEDILRDIVISLRNLEKIAYFSVECENYESIHNHNAYASHEEVFA